MSDNLSFAHVRAKVRAATCPGLNFWEKSCNGKAFVLRTIGVHAWLAELIWDKYCQPFLVPRVTLYYVLVWMKQYPFSWMLRKFHPEHLPRIGKHAAMQHVTRGLRHLCQVMRTEISPDHFRHPNNEVPHFPGTIGSWDTFPIRVFSGRGRYQPKYKNAVVKFQGITTHMGLFAYVSGPHPGQMSDTTLARKYRPLLRASDTLLADLAYLSVPNCLPPVKKPQGGDITFWQKEFNRIHQFYRARVEHQFGHLHTWAIIRSRFRSTNLRALRQAITVLCAIRNMSLCFNIPYVPYTAA